MGYFPGILSLPTLGRTTIGEVEQRRVLPILSSLLDLIQP